ncbi:ABC transporter ATP-binding protein [Actinomyces sp. 2119]|uniref:ABC transporter ATP-binding protein n=1 Tax=Actinomyces lilanjuaniae TaxID=2321394 RepID=A0ABN5PNM6_9ACTO|nr:MULTISPECIES: ABC transporter ATP-binding protein [Actinomyces]AYD89906.1 ABC transporter ATP-binding protein [Actinomyces lilanjuaniae]RJF44897.1 ABC transporter ATP-binding protein [Actinomyces sp. 2119]
MTCVLHLDDVTLTRGTTVVLDHVSLAVEESEHWVVLGPNGAGKTTLARLAAARLFPSSGTVDILSERLGRVDVSELRPRIGLCSSALSSSVLGSERVVDVVLSAAYGYTGRWRERYDDLDTERAEALLQALGAGYLSDRRWATLSSGERKRVEIARALMPDPELLVLDEPACGLDVAGREQLLAALADIVQDPGSPSLLMVTHHLEEIPPGITHAMALRQGRVQQVGPVEEVLTDAVMTATFGLPLEVVQDRGRYWARGAAERGTVPAVGSA